MKVLMASGLLLLASACSPQGEPPTQATDPAAHAGHETPAQADPHAAHDRHDGGHGDRHGPATDNRELIPLNAEERHFMLTEMRMFVANTHGILDALNSKDHARAAELAWQLGLRAHTVEMAAEHGPMAGIRKKVPLGFMMTGRATHVAFDDLADLARKPGTDRDALYRALTDAMSRCDGCHQQYRVH